MIAPVKSLSAPENVGNPACMTSASVCLRALRASVKRFDEDATAVVGGERERMPITLERDRAVAIGAKDLGADGPVAIEDRGRGMTEAVAAPDADDRGARRQALHESRGARGQAAVVRHLDDAQRRRTERGRQRLLHPCAAVAR